VARKRAALTTLIERIEVRVDRIDIGLRPPRLAALLDGPDTSPQGANDEETELVLTYLDISATMVSAAEGPMVRRLSGGCFLTLPIRWLGAPGDRFEKLRRDGISAIPLWRS
jgi:hypothetical protein